MNKKELVICLFLIFFLLPGCTQKLVKSKGWARQFDLPIYKGMPPEEYPYQDLGYVKGEYKPEIFDSSGTIISLAFNKIVEEAKRKGANAVINLKEHTERNVFYYDGQAVLFEVLPKEPDRWVVPRYRPQDE